MINLVSVLFLFPAIGILVYTVIVESNKNEDFSKGFFTAAILLFLLVLFMINIDKLTNL